jgi:hypothetical protein
MREHDLKQALQRIAVRTQFPPFVWLYRALYALAIRLCVRRFRRIRGVRSIYLRRGLTTDQASYGLSDIDLLLLTDDEQARRIADRAQHDYELLRRIVPMLAKGELAVYSVEQFRALYQYSAFYRQRSDRGRHQWRRLHGEDAFQHLPPQPAESDSPAAQELGPAWHYLSQELSPDDERPTYLRRYVAGKWIAEAARAALVAQGEDADLPREAAVDRASQALPEVSAALRKVQAQRKHLLSPEPYSADTVLDTYLFLARKALANGAGSSGFTRRLRILSALPGARAVRLRESTLAAARETCAGLDGIEEAVLVPRLGFQPIAEIGMDPAALAGATVDAFDLVLMGDKLPPVAVLREFNRSFAALRPGLEPYFCDGEVAVALQPVRGRPIKDPRRDPEFFACLSSAKPLDGGIRVADGVEVERAFGQQDTLEHRAASLLALFRNGDAFRLPALDFLVLFWEAGRAAWLVTQLEESTIDVPVTSEQVVDALSVLTPEAAQALRRIHQEYVRELRGESSEAVRYMHWAGLYASQLAHLLFEHVLLSPGRSTVELPPEARTELTMSVLIVTRNRAAQLDRALDSLVEQERCPDQVVVVDNASSDGTPGVVLSYGDRLDVTLIHEENVGIPHARNAGLRHCTGDIVASMDDDCQAHSRWLAELEVPFLKDARIGAVGGSLVPLEEQQGLVARFYGTRMQALAGTERTTET